MNDSIMNLSLLSQSPPPLLPSSTELQPLSNLITSYKSTHDQAPMLTPAEDEDSVIAELQQYLSKPSTTASAAASIITHRPPSATRPNPPTTSLFSNVPGPISLSLSSFGIEGVSLLEARFHSLTRQIKILTAANSDGNTAVTELNELLQESEGKVSSLGKSLELRARAFDAERVEILTATAAAATKQNREIDRLRSNLKVVQGRANEALLDRARRDAEKQMRVRIDEADNRYNELDAAHERLLTSHRALKKENASLKREVVAAEESSDKKAEVECRALLRDMRASMDEHASRERESRAREKEEWLTTMIPIEEHKRELERLREEMSYAKEAIVNLYSGKLKVGGLASELKWRILSGGKERAEEGEQEVDVL